MRHGWTIVVALTCIGAAGCTDATPSSSGATTSTTTAAATPGRPGDLDGTRAGYTEQFPRPVAVTITNDRITRYEPNRGVIREPALRPVARSGDSIAAEFDGTSGTGRITVTRISATSVRFAYVGGAGNMGGTLTRR